MPKKIFILNYQGSKYQESKHLDSIDYSKYDTIVEIFGGSFGFIRHLYYDLGLKDKKYIVYDNDRILIDFYNAIKNDEFDVEEYRRQCDVIFRMFSLGKDKSQIDGKKALKYIENNITGAVMNALILNMRSRITRVYRKKNVDFEIFKHIDFHLKNANDIDLKTYNPETTLFYLDPPYIMECNRWYSAMVKDSFKAVLKLMRGDYKTIFIHSYNVVLDHIFGTKTLMTYETRYKTMSAKETHVVYSTI